MELHSDRDCLAFALFDLWMTRELEQLVVRWSSWAAPCASQPKTSRKARERRSDRCDDAEFTSES